MDALKSELTCPVCLQLYNRPIWLPCLHSLCTLCAQSLINQAQSTPAEKGQSTKEIQQQNNNPIEKGDGDCDVGLNVKHFQCPVCRADVKTKCDVTTGSLQLPANRLLQNIVDRYRTVFVENKCQSEATTMNGKDEGVGALIENGCGVVEEGVAELCDMCEDDSPPEKATKFCLECKVLYCDSCFTQCHRMKGPFASHTIKSPKDSMRDSVSNLSAVNGTARPMASVAESLTCEVHCDEKTNMYCIDCDQLICALCKLVGGHKEHEVNDLNTSYKMKQQLLGEKCDALIETSLNLTNCLQKLKDSHLEFTESRDSTEKQILEEIAQLESLLKSRKDWMLKRLFDHYNQNLTSLESCTSDVKNKLESTHSLLSFSTEAIKENDPISFLQFCAQLCKRVTEACESASVLAETCSKFDFDNNSEYEPLCVDLTFERKTLANMSFLKIPPPVKIETDLCVCKANELKVRWKPSLVVPVSQYNVIYRAVGNEEWITCPEISLADEEDADGENCDRNSSGGGNENDNNDRMMDKCEIVIDGLESDTMYEVCVIAVNLAGQSPDDDLPPVFLKTALPVPKVPEIDIEDCYVERNSIQLKWKSDLELSTSKANINEEQSIITFVIEYKPEDDDSSRVSNDHPSCSNTWTVRRHMESTEMTLCDLLYNTVYVVRMKAVSSTGSSDYSPEIVFTTWPLPPSCPKIMEEHCTGQGNKYQIQWKNEDNRKDNGTDSYIVEYRPTKQGADWITFEGIEMTHCHLKDLLYDTEYTVRVKALNISGESDYSDSIVVKTGSPPIKFNPDVVTTHVNLKITGSTVCYDRGGAKSRNMGESCFLGASFSVLGDKSVMRGKHYWETRTKLKSSDRIGVAYQSTARDCLIGDSDKSWSVGFLASEDGKLFCYHNKKKKKLNFEFTSSPMKTVTIGTLVDMDEGFVAFFLTELNQHLHTFKIHFTEPIYPAFSVWPADIQINSGLQVPDSLLL